MNRLTCAMCGQVNVSHKKNGQPCEGHCIGRRHQEALTLFQTAMNALDLRHPADFDAASQLLASVRRRDVADVRAELGELFAEGLEPEETERRGATAKPTSGAPAAGAAAEPHVGEAMWELIQRFKRERPDRERWDGEFADGTRFRIRIGGRP
jgi:hypothetical protein